MAFYTSPRLYIQDADDIKDKITRIDAVISAMIDAALKAASGEEVKEYRLDDGQTKINVISRSSEEIERGIRAMERIKNYYVNKYNGHGTVLRDFNTTRFLKDH